MHLRLGIVVVLTASALSACGSGSSKAAAPTPTSARPTTSTAQTSGSASSTSGTLQEAARAWANAYLTGTADQMTNLQGPECLSGVPVTTPANERAAAAQLQQMRAQLRQQLGIDLSAITIKGVAVRNVTATSGEAAVDYGLPASIVGNDNWVTYERRAGQWKVADCHAPIGGSSSSGSETVPAP